MLLFPYTFVRLTVLLPAALVKLSEVGFAQSTGVGVAVGAPDWVTFTSTCLPFVVSVNVIVPVLDVVFVFVDTFTV